MGLMPVRRSKLEAYIAVSKGKIDSVDATGKKEIRSGTAIFRKSISMASGDLVMVPGNTFQQIRKYIS